MGVCVGHIINDKLSLKMETTKKDLEYYRKNAEEDYLTTPISVLRYITEMEQSLRIHDVKRRFY